MRLLRLRGPDGVSARTGRPPASIYWLIGRGLFPKPIKLGERCSAWTDAEVDAINAAYARGASDDEIRALVGNLVAARQTAEKRS